MIPRLSSDDYTAELHTAVARALDVDGANDAKDFFTGIIGWDFSTRGRPTSKQIAKDLGVVTSSLLSRFFRAGLPSPKAVVDSAFLVRLIGMHQRHPEYSIYRLSIELRLSSPQHLGRFVRRLRGTQISAWFASATAESEIERFVNELVLPHSERWKSLSLADSEMAGAR
jgi:hypothetical protein